MGAVPALRTLTRELSALADPERARNLAWFFKTGSGEYGEGDRFLGITVPVLRKVARGYRELPLDGIAKLLASEWHEHRLIALLILVAQYADAPDAVFDFYIAQTARINNWDLVDASAPYIAGAHLLARPRHRKLLYRFAMSDNLWERRIAIVSTLAFIRAGELDDAFAISSRLLRDKHDLIHKAVGWMLREAGKRDEARLLAFLRQHYAAMPRTALRYAIERFPEPRRRQILRGEFWRRGATLPPPPGCVGYG